MRIASYVRIRILTWVTAGSLLGALGGFGLGRAMLLRTAKSELSFYAQQLSSNAEELSDEINSVLSKGNAPAGPGCSDEDLAALKVLTFRFEHVKDVGRTHAGKLYCSAFLGRLGTPYIEGTPSLVLGAGVNIYTNVAVVIDSTGNDHGTVVEDADVDVVLNSSAFGSWDRPHSNYMVAAINREVGQATQIAGSKLEIEPAWVLSHQSQISGGSVYRVACSRMHPVCVVTTERLADIWSSTRSTQIVYTGMGGFGGLSFGLTIAFLYWRASSHASQLLRALRKNSPSLSVVYQPILDIGTGRCIGSEALIRWTDQDGAQVPPDVFIPIAEECRFISEITAFVARRATKELSDLLRSSTDFTLSINVAASDLCDERLFALLNETVCSVGIDPNQIALELTERSTASIALVRVAIQRLRADGYKVHIDDFGVGFSGLSYLDQLQVNAIKIDRSFTRTIGTDAMIAPVLDQMLEMASSLGLQVIVEGVETKAQRDYLAASDKSLQVQGWYFGRPVKAEEIYSIVAKSESQQPSDVITRGSKQFPLDSMSHINSAYKTGTSDPATQADDHVQSSALLC